MPKPTKVQTAKDEFRKVFKTLGPPEGGLPRLGNKVSNITSDKLGDLLAQYSAWREYCEDMHLSSLADYMLIKEQYDIAVAKEMVITIADDVTTKKATAQISNSVLPLRKAYVQREVYLKMISSKLDSFSNSLSMLSRELTRRGIINV